MVKYVREVLRGHNRREFLANVSKGIGLLAVLGGNIGGCIFDPLDTDDDVTVVHEVIIDESAVPGGFEGKHQVHVLAWYWRNRQNLDPASRPKTFGFAVGSMSRGFREPRAPQVQLGEDPNSGDFQVNGPYDKVDWEYWLRFRGRQDPQVRFFFVQEV